MILHRAHFVTKSGLVPGLIKQLRVWDVFLSLCSEPSQRLVALRGVPAGMNHGAKCRHSACAANSIRTSLPSQRGSVRDSSREIPASGAGGKPALQQLPETQTC